MRKGLTWTLMTVLAAAFSVQAMAEAPVISDLKDIVIGDAEDTSEANVFVYEDVINLNDVVTDDVTADGDIAWSYWDNGDGTYTINGVASLVLGTDDPVAPGSKEISATGAVDAYEGAVNGDGDPITITVRNEALSPVGGSAPYADPAGGPGILADQTKMLSLIASDGEDISSQAITVYTDDDGEDRLSPDTILEPVGTLDFAGSAGSLNWTYSDLFGTTAVDGTADAGGLCLTTVLAGDNAGVWTSPYGGTSGLDIVGDSVYRLRMDMYSSQTTPGAQPLWDVNLTNGSADGSSAGRNIWGMDFWLLGQPNGANALTDGQGGGGDLSEVLVYINPAMVEVAEWNTYLNDSANAGTEDGVLNFRTIDYASAAYAADQDQGTVCINSIEIERFSPSAETEIETVYEDTDLSDWTFNPLLSASQININGGNAEISAVGGSFGASDVSFWDLEPADYPVQWEANTLYKLEVDMRSADAASVSENMEFIYVRLDFNGSEIFMENFIVDIPGTGGNPGTALSTYTTYLWSHNVTGNTTAGIDRLRGRVAGGALADTSLALSDGSGTLVVEAVRIKKIAAE